MASAEELAEKGDIEGSKFKVELADEIKEAIKELEDKFPEYAVTMREEWVCDVCGTRTEAITENNTARFKAHFTGKVHVGYEKIREWVKDIRKRQRDAEVTRTRREDGDRDERRKRRGSRSKDRQADGRSGREADADRKRRRSRSREERGKDKDRDMKDGGGRERRGEDRGRRRS